MKIERTLNLLNLLSKKSHFLFGPRGTGKSFLIAEQLAAPLVIDLLDDDTYSRLIRRPALLPRLIPKGTELVVIDEVQRIPELLNEVHALIEKKHKKFLLTGSSARKLIKGSANLLGGRAWEARLHPLTWHELGPHFNLERYLNYGGLPFVYLSQFPEDELKNYVRLYVKEEIQAEALVKRLDHFARFLDVSALTNLQELNFEGIANDSGVPARTVASYFEILEGTLMGFQLPSFDQTRKRKAIKRSKFVFFDVGVAGALAKRGKVAEGGELFGRCFEHFLIQELRAYLSYSGQLDVPLQYWRSTTQCEVDVIVGNDWAIEIKSTERVSDKHLSGLLALQEEKLIRKFFLVSRDPLERTERGVEVLPWEVFLKRLWGRGL